MITAKEVKERVKLLSACEGVDEFIEHTLIPKFVGTNTVTVTESKVGYGGKGWLKDNFVSAMVQRGFDVEYTCEDRPCGGCYYTISLPFV